MIVRWRQTCSSRIARVEAVTEDEVIRDPKVTLTEASATGEEKRVVGILDAASFLNIPASWYSTSKSKCALQDGTFYVPKGVVEISSFCLFPNLRFIPNIDDSVTSTTDDACSALPTR